MTALEVIAVQAMGITVVRTDLRRRRVGEPLACSDPHDMTAPPGDCTLEECIHSLLKPDEMCLGTGHRRTILIGARAVGYIEIVIE
jgi:hypothetical protein